MDKVLNYIILFFNYLEYLRDWAYEKTAGWVEKREIATKFINNIENNFKKFHPFTLVIGFMILFFIIKFIIKKIRKGWRSISKSY